MSAQDRLAETVRVEGRRILATLDRTLGDLQLAEDAVQDATVAALRTWPRAGIPEDPRAWLTVTARHKAYDALRREAARPVKETTATWGVEAIGDDVEMEALQMTEPDSVVRDDLLRLVFICCHPALALALEAQVALAQRTLAGLDVSAIARALLVNEPTMAKRLVRARRSPTRGFPTECPQTRSCQNASRACWGWFTSSPPKPTRPAAARSWRVSTSRPRRCGWPGCSAS